MVHDKMTDNNWIEWKWTPEKPYPETLETRVHVKCKDGWNSVDSGCVDHVRFWWEEYNYFKPEDAELHDEGSTITHYKVVK